MTDVMLRAGCPGAAWRWPSPAHLDGATAHRRRLHAPRRARCRGSVGEDRAHGHDDARQSTSAPPARPRRRCRVPRTPRRRAAATAACVDLAAERGAPRDHRAGRMPQRLQAARDLRLRRARQMDLCLCRRRARDRRRDDPAGAALYAATADGLIPWKQRPDALKKGVVSRVPPLRRSPVRPSAGGRRMTATSTPRSPRSPSPSSPASSARARRR